MRGMITRQGWSEEDYARICFLKYILMLEWMWRKGNPLTLLVGMQAGTVTLENSMEVPHKVETRATL